MRESIGGAWLFTIVIVFIFFFAGFLAYSISYTKAFNVKNQIINYIEQNEGYSAGGSDLAAMSDEDLSETVEGKAYKFIRATGYNYSGAQGIQCEGTNNYTNEGGYCIVKYCPMGSSMPNSNTHYKVTTYIALKLPVIEIIVKIPISGETRTIYSDPWNYPCTVD
jgi:hypothetical protein